MTRVRNRTKIDHFKSKVHLDLVYICYVFPSLPLLLPSPPSLTLRLLPSLLPSPKASLKLPFPKAKAYYLFPFLSPFPSLRLSFLPYRLPFLPSVSPPFSSPFSSLLFFFFHFSFFLFLFVNSQNFPQRGKFFPNCCKVIIEE